MVFVASDKVQAFNQKLKFWKYRSCLIDAQYLQIFLIRRTVILANVGFLVLYYEMCHLEDLLNSMNQHFLNNQCMIL